jgi:hypothetical protein
VTKHCRRSLAPEQHLRSRFDGRFLQVNLVCDSRPVPVVGGIARRNPCTSAARGIDRLMIIGLYRLTPKVSDSLKIVQPETVIPWHRARACRRWRSRRRGGRPKIRADIRQPILEMSVANSRWERHGLRANCSSSGSMSAKPQLQNIWSREGSHHRQAGRLSFAIMPTVSRHGHVCRPHDFISTTIWAAGLAAFVAGVSMA